MEWRDVARERDREVARVIGCSSEVVVQCWQPIQAGVSANSRFGRLNGTNDQLSGTRLGFCVRGLVTGG